MKLFGIMLVKDEIDIIQSTLQAAEPFFDRIIVIDNGSSDGSWELIQKMGNETIIPWKQDLREYSNGLRADAFNEFRHEMEDGDWWCYKMDADEFYVDDPKEFLTIVPKEYHTVFKRSIDFLLTYKDLKEHEFVGNFEIDRQFIRYFKPKAYSEPRFFKHRRRLKWRPGVKSPDHIGIRWHQPITVKHFQWRSPKQIQHRLDIRRKVRKVGSVNQFRHITATHWKEMIEDHRNLVLDQEEMDYSEIPLTKDLCLPVHEFIMKRLLHGIGVFP